MESIKRKNESINTESSVVVCQRWIKWVKGTKKYMLPVMSPGEVKYSMMTVSYPYYVAYLKVARTVKVLMRRKKIL